MLGRSYPRDEGCEIFGVRPLKKPEATYQLVRAMIERGNRSGLIREWMYGLANWAEHNPGQDAVALRNWLSYAKPKPFYTATELALMWPALKFATGLTKRMEPAPSPFKLAAELEWCGLPYLGGGRTYYPRYTKPDKFFIVERIPHWRKALPNQEEFERALHNL